MVIMLLSFPFKLLIIEIIPTVRPGFSAVIAGNKGNRAGRMTRIGPYLFGPALLNEMCVKRQTAVC